MSTRRPPQLNLDSQRPAPPRQPPAWASDGDTGAVVWRCWNCQKVLGEYQPPIGMFTRRCQFCRQWNTLTTEDVA